MSQRPRPDEHASASADDIFSDFVRRANAEWIASVQAVLSEPEPIPVPADEGTDRIVLLTQRKSSRPPPADDVTVSRHAALRRNEASEQWRSVVPERSQTTQRREAALLVPDVASVPAPPRPPPEKSEDGLVPSHELDRKLSDMEVLLRYGHAAQVQSELEALRLGYPHDLLLLRRIAEFYVKHAMRAAALEALFALAAGLFERRNVEGMKQALEQVLVLDAQNGRARRLLALLDRRPTPQRDPR